MLRRACTKAAIATAFALSISTTANAQSASPISLPWNTDAGIGPDGPWNYLVLNVGSGPSSRVYWYPQFDPEQSYLIRSDVCGKSVPCLNPTPGYYNAASESATQNTLNINATLSNMTWSSNSKDDTVWWAYDWVDSAGTGDSANFNNPNLDMQVITNASFKVGTKSYVPISLLSMESTAFLHGIKNMAGSFVGRSTMLQQYSMNTNGSLAFGLHMGSAGASQSGSLVFGGYDQNRIIERPAKSELKGPFQSISSISFGVSSGAAPWQHITEPLPSNFLDQFFSDNPKINDSFSVSISPSLPYFRFPSQVCKRFHEFMPTYWDQETNLYLWNTTHPSYPDFITSPSYINFTFGTSPATSIRVPFVALNLNLTAPLKDQPTPYFPCQIYDGDTNGYDLGRAFLQSAFIMLSHSASDATKGSFYVGQAPGPSVTGTNFVSINDQNPDVAPANGAPKWEDTWNQILKPLSAAATFTPSPSALSPSATASSAATTLNPSDPPSPSAVSAGTIAGIVVGIVLGVALLVGAAVWFWRRRRAARQPPPAVDWSRPPAYPSDTKLPLNYYTGAREVIEMEGYREYQELDSAPRLFEMGAGRASTAQELPASTKF